MPGKGKSDLLDFIDDIPDEKLSDIRDRPYTIHKDADVRLDMQGVRPSLSLFPPSPL